MKPIWAKMPLWQNLNVNWTQARFDVFLLEMCKKRKKIFSHFESAPLLSPTVLPAGPADRLLQLCLTLIGCFSSFLTGFGQCVSYFTPDVSVSTFCRVRVGCLPVSQRIRKTAQDQWDQCKDLLSCASRLNYCIPDCRTPDYRDHLITLGDEK